VATLNDLLDRPGTRSLFLREANAVNGSSATSAREIHCPVGACQTASVYSIRVHPSWSSAMAVMAALTRRPTARSGGLDPRCRWFVRR